MSELDDLRAEVVDLRERLARLEQAPPAASTVAPPAERIDRRRALAGLAGAAVAGTAAVVAGAEPAAATNLDPIKIATANTGTGGTALSVTGTTASHGFAVIDQTVTSLAAFPAALVGIAQSELDAGVIGSASGVGNAVVGIRGRGQDRAVGVEAISERGVAGHFSTGSQQNPALQVQTDTGVAIRATGRTQLSMVPSLLPSPPGDDAPSVSGDLRWQAAGPQTALWACIGDGTPGTWRKLVGTGTAGAFHLLPTPMRAYDSRPGTTPSRGPKTPLPAGNVARTIDLKINATVVPAGATGVLLTVLVVNASAGSGNLTVWADDQGKPQSNTLVWGGNAGRFTTMAMTAVDAQARVKVDASLKTDLVLDVVGYYR